MTAAQSRLQELQLVSGHIFYSLESFFPQLPLMITVLRDPVSRTLSHYAHLNRSPELFFLDSAKTADLLACLRDPEMRPFFENFQARYLALSPSPASIRAELAAGVLGDEERERRVARSSFIGPLRPPGMSDEELFDRASRRLEEMGCFGVADRLAESMQLLCYTFGWKPIQEVEELNVSPNRIPRSAASEEVLIAIRQLTTIDASLYKFASELFSARVRRMQFELLDQLYFLRNHTVIKNRPSFPDYFKLELDRPIRGHGWRGPEKMPDGIAFQWTTLCNSTVYVGVLDIADYMLAVDVVMAMRPDLVGKVRLWMNDEPLKIEFSEGRDGIALLNATVPCQSLMDNGGGNWLTLSTPDILLPPGGNEMLGIAVNRLELRAVSTNGPGKEGAEAERASDSRTLLSTR
jgi:hypothetical protein